MTVAQPILAPFVTPPARKLRRVVIATINRAEGDTGVHAHTRMLSEGLREAGVACEVVSPFSGSRKWLLVFAVRPLLLHRINRTWSTLWHRRWHLAALRENLRRHLDDHAIDVVLAQCPVSARAALDVRREAGEDFAVVLVCHFNHSEATEYRDKGELRGERRCRGMLEFENRVLESVDHVIYVSDWARRTVEGTRGLRTRASSVIANGLPDAHDQAQLTRAQLGLGEEDLVLVNVGSLEPRKNQLGLIDFFAAVRHEFPSAKLVLAGDGPARREIEQKVAERHLGDAVRLLGHRRDVRAILPLGDLYVHYAAMENCPLALLEAARAGLPIAAVPAGGVAELQSALQCRIALWPDDPRKSMETLRPILRDESLRRALGATARARCGDRYTAQAMTKRYLDALGMR